MSGARIGILLATIAGLAVALWTFGIAGIGETISVARRIGVGGFLLYCLWSCGVFVILGAAWLVAAPGEGIERLGRFAWARAVREGVADLLPLSQIGGIVVGAGTLTSAGMSATRVYASLIVDMTTEMASQLIFTAYGVAMAIALVSGAGQAAGIRTVILAAALAMIVLLALVLVAQRTLPAAAGGLARRVLPASVATMDALRSELARIYTHRLRVGGAFAFNLLAWIASAAGAWIVLDLIGVDVSITRILAIESLIFTLRSVAFAIPGGLGVQEAGYALIAPALGLPLETALALALAKRARDLVLGLLTIILWQVNEARSIHAR